MVLNLPAAGWVLDVNHDFEKLRQWHAFLPAADELRCNWATTLGITVLSGQPAADLARTWQAGCQEHQPAHVHSCRQAMCLACGMLEAPRLELSIWRRGAQPRPSAGNTTSQLAPAGVAGMPHIAPTGLSGSMAPHTFMYPPMPPRAAHSTPQPSFPPGKSPSAPRPSQAAGYPLSASRPPAAAPLAAKGPMPAQATPRVPPPADSAPPGSTAGLPAAQRAPPGSQPLDLTGSAPQPKSPSLATPGKHGRGERGYQGHPPCTSAGVSGGDPAPGSPCQSCALGIDQTPRVCTCRWPGQGQPSPASSSGARLRACEGRGSWGSGAGRRGSASRAFLGTCLGRPACIPACCPSSGWRARCAPRWAPMTPGVSSSCGRSRVACRAQASRSSCWGAM